MKRKKKKENETKSTTCDSIRGDDMRRAAVVLNAAQMLICNPEPRQRAKGGENEWKFQILSKSHKCRTFRAAKSHAAPPRGWDQANQTQAAPAASSSVLADNALRI